MIDLSTIKKHSDIDKLSDEEITRLLHKIVEQNVELIDGRGVLIWVLDYNPRVYWDDSSAESHIYPCDDQFSHDVYNTIKNYDMHTHVPLIITQLFPPNTKLAIINLPE